ncbi:MAG: glycosyltransferase family 2 protein [Blastochloris sp.]|nr:glycosyltransferase family 2 protein [Blastochloris sp.]
MLLTIALIACDEERHIGLALASVNALRAAQPTEVLVLLDQRSRDRTADISCAHGVRVVVEPWRGFPAQRNRALALSKGEWVLFLDADEQVTPALCTEIATVLQGPPSDNIVGYGIPRHNRFFGQVVRGGGWYPDYQLRLLRRSRARYDEQQHVHEAACLSGEVGYLHTHLLHNNIERLDEFWQKQARYALAEARMLYQAGRRTRLRNFIGAPAREFWRRYVRLGGWRDGALGLFLCGSLAWFEVVKFGMLTLLSVSTQHAPYR